MPRIVSMNELYPAWHITFGKQHQLADNDVTLERGVEAYADEPESEPRTGSSQRERSK